jgi:hypothetical protein
MFIPSRRALLFWAVLAVAVLGALRALTTRVGAGFVAERQLEGFWSADPRFCGTAGLSRMHLVVTAPGRSGLRRAYLDAERADGVPIAAEPLRMRFQLSRGLLGGDRGTQPGEVGGRVATMGIARGEGKKMTHGAPPLWPADLSVAVDPVAARMRLFDGKRTWAVLHRDPVASAAAAAT